MEQIDFSVITSIIATMNNTKPHTILEQLRYQTKIINAWNVIAEKLDINQTELDEKIQEILASVASLTSRVDGIDTQITGILNDLSSIVSRLSTAESDIASNTSAITALDGRVSTAESDITALDGRVSTAESNITANTLDITALTSRIGMVESDISSLQARVSALETAIANKQDTLISGTNIKTIGGVSILGSGNIPLPEAQHLYEHFITLEATDDEDNNAIAYIKILSSNNQTIDISALQSYFNNLTNHITSCTGYILTYSIYAIRYSTIFSIRTPDDTEYDLYNVSINDNVRTIF